MKFPKKVIATIQSRVIDETAEDKYDTVHIVGVLSKKRTYLALYHGILCEAAYNQYARSYTVYDVYERYIKKAENAA